MVKAKRPRDTPEQQSARFIEAAKKAEADDRPEEFERVLRKVATKKLIPRK